MEEFSEIRRAILHMLKTERAATIAEIAGRLNVTYEAVRQQLAQIEAEGWITKSLRRSGQRNVGRPTSYYSLTPAGDHLFPKNYDLLASELLSTITGQIGTEALGAILASLTESRVRKWEPMMHGLNLQERVLALKDFYLQDDPFTEMEASADGLRLTERNCPFLNVAGHHPALCSVTVSTLARLLGCRVVREERFQNGDQRCTFRILQDQPIDPSFRFSLEEEL
jgi:predicted ArsR family transcriptional regulator